MPTEPSTKIIRQPLERSADREVEGYLLKIVVWNEGPSPIYPYIAALDGDELVLRLNDFPEEHLYTLFVNKSEVLSFDEWPDMWIRP